jgi:23S rRNA (cytidine1920-2'-O)/16S rRNA (cytidine1409-2'-O)-methyltransferase
MIMAGEILSGDQRLDKSGVRVKQDIPLRWRPRRGHGYVGRGGLKMEGALRHFEVNPKGWTCLDLGMSTGGFTDCLLQWGAQRVYGVDVGRELAHQRLVLDDRVVIIEGTHVRDLTHELIPEACDLCVADISFNSLSRIIAPAIPFLKPEAYALFLVKPQFELSARELEESGERGVVLSEEARRLALTRVSDWLSSTGWVIVDHAPSKTKGTKGNQEYFIYAQRLSEP